MKEPKEFSKNKHEFNRELINQHFPYELFAFYTLRHYAQLQEEGKLDIINLFMFVEGLSEAEAYEKALFILKLLNAQQISLVASLRELTSRDVDLEVEHFRKN